MPTLTTVIAPVNIHEAQIRQQTVNKGRANTVPDYCQRGNMVDISLSVLIMKKGLSEVAIQNGNYSTFTMAG